MTPEELAANAKEVMAQAGKFTDWMSIQLKTYGGLSPDQIAIWDRMSTALKTEVPDALVKDVIEKKMWKMVRGQAILDWEQIFKHYGYSGKSFTYGSGAARALTWMERAFGPAAVESFSGAGLGGAISDMNPALGKVVNPLLDKLVGFGYIRDAAALTSPQRGRALGKAVGKHAALVGGITGGVYLLYKLITQKKERDVLQDADYNSFSGISPGPANRDSMRENTDFGSRRRAMNPASTLAARSSMARSRVRMGPDIAGRAGNLWKTRNMSHVRSQAARAAPRSGLPKMSYRPRLRYNKTSSLGV